MIYNWLIFLCIQVIGAPTNSLDSIKEPLLKKAKIIASKPRISEDVAAEIMKKLPLISAYNLATAYFHKNEALLGDSLNALALHNAFLDNGKDGALEYWFNIPTHIPLKLKVLLKLLENPTINFKKSNCLAITHAVLMDNTDIVKKLVDRGCWITHSAFLYAIYHKNFHMVQYLVETIGATPSLETVEAAVKVKDLILADYLYDSINKVAEMSDLKKKSWIKSLIYRENFKVIDYLIDQKGFELDNDHLNSAAIMGLKNVIYYLIEKRGLIPDAETLSSAINGGNNPVIFYLLLERNVGIYPNILSETAVSDNLEMLKFLINNYNLTPGLELVHIAIGRDSLPILQYLIENQNIEATNLSLNVAGIGGKLPIFAYLVEKVGIIPGQDHLNDAASFGHLNIVKYLIEKSRIKISKSTLINAVDSGGLKVVKYLTQIVEMDQSRLYSENDAIFDDRILISAVNSVLDRTFSIVKYLVEEIHIIPTIEVFRNLFQDINMNLFKYLLEHIDLSKRENRFEILALAMESNSTLAINYLLEEKGFRQDTELLNRPLFSGLASK